MSNIEAKEGSEFYDVLGLKKECTSTDLKMAYRKLAMRWHPDRWSSSGNSKYLEEANKKFQAIQEAYSVLSDDNKRMLYDAGLYNDDDDENDMADFMSEMADTMSQIKCTGNNRNESLEDLQDMFVEMFHSDLVGIDIANFSPMESSYSSFSECLNARHKRNSTEMNTEKLHGSASAFNGHIMEGFCLGMGGTSGKWQNGGRKTKRNAKNRRK